MHIAHEVDCIIRRFGMQRLLREMIAQTEQVKQDEQENWPERDTSYLDKLVEDLKLTVTNYEARYLDETQEKHTFGGDCGVGWTLDEK